MRQSQPVLWTKGVLLSPQHLQAQDRFLEDLIGFKLSALSFCPWGFRTLEIDREKLASGALAVSSASGLLPDGLLFDIPTTDPAPPPKSLDEAWEADATSLDVFLAIPEHRTGGINVAATKDDGSARYRAEVELRRDENTGVAEKPIQVAQKNFRLLVEGESLEGFATLPVARVVRQEGGEYGLDPQFVPPLVSIEASDYVMSIARRLVEILTAKSTSLAESRRQRNLSLADFGLSDIASFWLLYTVNGYLPLFRHIYETRRGHPAQLYETMLALAGSLTTFSDRVHPRDLPAYEHADLSGRLTVLDERLRELLETVVPANYVSLPLQRVEASVYATALDDDRYLRAPQLFLALKADLDQAELTDRVPGLVKVSSGDHIQRLIKQALPGLELTHTANPPSAVPVKLGYQYFSLSKSGPEWKHIEGARNVAAYVPSDFPDPQAELVILLPPERD